jgi:hypothetical protein
MPSWLRILVGSDPQLCAVGERPHQIFDLHRNAIRIFTVNRRIVELCGVFEQDGFLHIGDLRVVHDQPEQVGLEDVEE